MDYEVEIGLDESITDAANRYYSMAKKAKKKIGGVNIAMVETKKKLANAEKLKIVETEVIEKREKHWFEKYRWSFTRNDLLIIAGKDSASNEFVVKKYLEKNDLHFHTNIQGSAHVILKDGQKANKDDLEDTALIAAIYSKAWSAGIGSVDVYYVNSDQVSKTAQTGEYLSAGAFVIRGERNWFKKTKLEFSLGIIQIESKDIIMLASKESLLAHNSKKIWTIIPGNKKKSDMCNLLLKEIKTMGYKQFNINDLLSILPAGNFDFVKNR